MPATKENQASTQEHLDIEDIRDDLMLLKNGNVVAVLQTNAVNFDLLSEEEQDSMIFAYSQLLNSLSFPIQIIIRSKRMDISNYLLRLSEARSTQPNKALVSQMELYENFIKELVARNNVLDKRFYVVIPFVEINLSSINPFSTPKKAVYDKWTTLERAKVALGPKKEQLVKQLNRIGVKCKQLTTQELVELFYDVYNPSVAREQKVALSSSDYTTSVVEPAIETTFVSNTNQPAPKESVSTPMGVKTPPVKPLNSQQPVNPTPIQRSPIPTAAQGVVNKPVPNTNQNNSNPMQRGENGNT